MNEREIEQAMGFLVRTAKLYPTGSVDLGDPDVYEYWADKVMAPREFAHVMQIIEKFPQTETFFPTIKAFCDMYDGIASKDDDIGFQVVQKIRTAMRKHSVLWDLDGKHPSWWYERHAAAREYIGELGWAWVQDQGGWWQVCNGLADSSDFQWTSAAKTITGRYKQHRAFGENPPPIGLPAGPNPALNEAADVIDVQKIRAAHTSGAAAKFLEAASTTSKSSPPVPGKLKSFADQIAADIAAKRAEEESRAGKEPDVAAPISLAIDPEGQEGGFDGGPAGVFGGEDYTTASLDGAASG